MQGSTPFIMAVRRSVAAWLSALFAGYERRALHGRDSGVADSGRWSNTFASESGAISKEA